MNFIARKDTLIDRVLAELHDHHRQEVAGHLADYIPELAKADPSQFGIAIATADGAVYCVGDSETAFTIQSISKPFVFGLALEDHGRDTVLGKVGVEPSGDAFNSIVFDQRANRPFNPMVNAGAIATSALIKGFDAQHRLNRVTGMFERYVGHPVTIDTAVFRSEKATGHRNRAIAHLELNSGMIDDRVDEHLDLYFQQCSALVTCRDLAIMAATLANGGVNPLTGLRAIQADYVKNVIAVMNSCGMYDYSGEWSYRIGLPAKSGVGGGIIAVLPGRMGIGVFSPPLDERGNSLRGIKVCEDLSLRFGLNMFDVALNPTPSVRRQFTAASMSSKRGRNAAERAVLDAHSRDIHVLELRGDLNFTAIEQVSRRLADLPAATTHVILECARVQQIEPVAATLLAQLLEAPPLPCHVRLVNLPTSTPAGQAVAAAGISAALIFADLDQGLEWAEEAVLTENPVAAPQEYHLADMELLAGLAPAQLAQLENNAEHLDFAAGQFLFREGDPATHLYFLTAGEISVLVSAGENRMKRLTTLKPGMAFGEMALLDGERRSANVRAESAVSVRALELDQLARLAHANPAIHTTLLLNLGRQLSQRLRKANNEIRDLE